MSNLRPFVIVQFLRSVPELGNEHVRGDVKWEREIETQRIHSTVVTYQPDIM